MTNEHMKRCSTTLAIREMKIKTTVRYYFTSIKLAKIPSAGKYPKELKLPYTFGYKMVQLGRLGGSIVEHLPSAQVTFTI